MLVRIGGNKLWLFLYAALFLGLVSCGADDNASDIGAARDEYLQSQPYSSMLIEIHAIKGYEYDDTMETLLLPEINKIIDKPAGIEVIFNDDLEPAPSNDYAYSLAEIKSVETTNRQYYSGDQRAVLSILILDGKSEDSPEKSVYLAYTYGASSVVVFRKVIENFSSVKDTQGNPRGRLACYVETTVLLHEFGHILGLVNYSTPMVRNHEDSEHPGHCTNQNCIMFHNFETGNCIKLLYNRFSENRELNAFGEFCLEDLSALP